MLELHRNIFYNIITSEKRWVKTTYTHTHTPMQTQVISKTTNDRSSPIRRSFFSPLFAATSTFLVLFPSPSVVSVGCIGKRRRPPDFCAGTPSPTWSTSALSTEQRIIPLLLWPLPPKTVGGGSAGEEGAASASSLV